jgi:cobalt/nickel transport system permease protein
MHMSDALLSPAVGAAFWVGTLGSIAYCCRKVKKDLDEKVIPLMGAMGAFTFAAQMINFVIPGTGSSGHLGGGLILAILLGPHAAFIVMASVLTVQSLFFADGGLLALGCNIWNLAIYPCFIGYLFIYKPILRGDPSPQRIFLASLISAIAGLQLGAFSVVLQTVLSGRSELPFAGFVLLMQPIHFAIGLVEGFVTAGVVNFVRAARPELLEINAALKPIPPEFKLKKIALTFLALALLLGGVLAWFASSNPDGLEWAIQKVYGKSDLPGREKGIAAILKNLQSKTAILADYSLRKKDSTGAQEVPPRQKGSWPNVDSGSSVSGILGSAMMVGLIFLIGFGIKVVRKKGAQPLDSKKF